jgi:dTDP-4-dehydrorhamnose reductase
MNILLFGKNGQLGFELRRSLSPLGPVTALGSQELDLGDARALREVLRMQRPDVIVNAAAYTAVDRAESEPALAHAINANAPRVMAEEAHNMGAVLVHYSTDYVFDGTQSQPYTEDDQAQPQSVYGASKWAGEQAVQAHCAQHLILRTSWVLGAHGGNFAKTMLRLAQEREALSVVADQWGAPTSAALLADVTALLLHQHMLAPETFPFGLYHATACGKTNWHAYAQHVISRAVKAGREVRVRPEAIRPIASVDYPTPAQRPMHSQLDNGKLQNTFGLVLPDWTQGVDQVLDQILEK